MVRKMMAQEKLLVPGMCKWSNGHDVSGQRSYNIKVGGGIYHHRHNVNICWEVRKQPKH